MIVLLYKRTLDARDPQTKSSISIISIFFKNLDFIMIVIVFFFNINFKYYL